MKSSEIRSRFFSFFTKHNHQRVDSSPVIPAQDPTLLFTNAGMNQFKDLFLGKEVRSYKTAVTIQKCVRAGGKHNDLENVGFTKRHLTFFEMMGNFSFGDYFKKDAIVYAWQFLTEEIGLPIEKLHATVFETDDEAFALWHEEIGLPKDRIHRLGKETNFWQMGDMGPCGPCTEIFIDRGLSYGKATDTPATDSDRFLEIWNLVFMQYNQLADGSLKPLVQTGVDTGMGLERLSLITQGVDSVFQTDIFAPIIQAIEKYTGRSYVNEKPLEQAAFHVLADHIRSSVFLIAEGAFPSNEGRGYVLRKIIRRAALFAQKLDSHLKFADLVQPVIDSFAAIYPDLVVQKKRIYETIMQESDKFGANLSRGMVLLQDLFDQYVQTRSLPGNDIFKLYDTFGFPLELITAEVRNKEYAIDMVGFDRAMEQQRRQSGQKKKDALDNFSFATVTTTEFTGYESLITTAQVIGLIVDATEVVAVSAGQSVIIVPDKSPFFIVGGGQVPDQGWVTFAGYRVALEVVRFVGGGNAIGIQLIAPCDISIGDTIIQEVDPVWRRDAMKNHTATHLLQAALIERFGTQVKQAGSLVHPDYLRFDFTFSGTITRQDCDALEEVVNAKIMACIPVSANFMTLKEAQAQGALAFFGDKYKPEKVRMIAVNEFSKELCGGTHVANTGQIGFCKITEVLSPAAGLKRFVAVTGFKALALMQARSEQIKELSVAFKAKPENLIEAVEKQKSMLKDCSSQVAVIKQLYIESQLPCWVTSGIFVDQRYCVSICLPQLFSPDITNIVKKVGKHSAEQSICCLATVVIEGTVRFAVFSSDDLTQPFQTLKAQGIGVSYGQQVLQGGGTIAVDALKKILHM